MYLNELINAHSMKHIFFLLFFTSLSVASFSQTIIDFFESIPDSSLLNLTKEERKEIVKYSIDNKTEDDAIKDLMGDKINYTFSVVDLRNGYLRMIGAFEGHIQMCYWNMKDGKKLVAIYSEGCGPVCYVAQFDFYEYDGVDFKPINWRSIVPEIYLDFFGENSKSKTEELNKEDILATLLFELPRNGKNITAKWGNEDSQETYKKYGIGDRMNLIWNDGNFIKGEIYWE